MSGQLEELGSDVTAIEVDLATHQGVMDLYGQTLGRRVDVLIATMSVDLGHAFLDQSLGMIQRVVDANVMGLLALIHCVGRDMRDNGRGKILIAGSTVASTAGGCQAAFSGSKAFLEGFAIALRDELDETGITVTSMMFGTSDAALPSHRNTDLARMGFDAMEVGEANVAGLIAARVDKRADRPRRVSMKPGYAL